MTFAAIAAQLGEKPETIYSTYQRAIEKLRRRPHTLAMMLTLSNDLAEARAKERENDAQYS